MLKLRNDNRTEISIEGLKKIGATYVDGSRSVSDLYIIYKDGTTMVFRYSRKETLLVDVCRLTKYYRFSKEDFIGV